jgi:N-acetylglutamate synthase-like GNAT family acetyltransferase
MAQQQGITVRRASVSDAARLAAFVNQAWQGRTAVDRQAVLERSGSVGFLLAERDGNLVGMLGWQVENLVVRVTDFLAWPAAEGAAAGQALFANMEQAARELQCEAAILFLPRSIPPQVAEFLKTLGYTSQVVASLPQAWREAAYEGRLENEDAVFVKRLRTDRVLRPI